MSFQEHLKNVADKLENLSGLAIADSDGIIVEEYQVDPSLDMPSLVAEYGTLWQGIDRAGLSSDIGATREFSILTEKTSLVIRKISRGYFLLLAISSEKNLGKGRFYTRIAADALVADLEA